MISTRIILCSAATIALMSCADVPDFDDPREFAASASGEEPSCGSLLRNGDFDDGQILWTSSPNESIRYEEEFPNIEFLHAHSGSYFLWLGGEYGVTRTVSQTVDVPAYATGLTLEGKTIVGSEAEDSPVEDTLELEILDYESGSVLETAMSWSNRDTTDSNYWSWRDFRANIGGDYSGQSVVLRWTSATDQSDNTNFIFDTLTLKPSNCP